jgi:hypothetical protein
MMKKNLSYILVFDDKIGPMECIAKIHFIFQHYPLIYTSLFRNFFQRKKPEKIVEEPVQPPPPQPSPNNQALRSDGRQVNRSFYKGNFLRKKCRIYNTKAV